MPVTSNDSGCGGPDGRAAHAAASAADNAPATTRGPFVRSPIRLQVLFADLPTAFSRKRPNDAPSEDRRCSDMHGRHDRLLTVLGAMGGRGRRALVPRDLVGSEPVTPELVGAARLFNQWTRRATTNQSQISSVASGK